MDRMTREMFMTYSRSREHAGRLDEANTIIAAAFERYASPYVAFSGGKDSIAMLALIMGQRPTCNVMLFDYGPTLMPRAVHAEILDAARAAGCSNIDVRTDPAFWRGGQVHGFSIIKTVVPKLQAEGRDAAFVGIRGQESAWRRARIKSGKDVSAVPEIWPLASWTWMDVWALIVSRRLKYPSTYDKEAPLLGWGEARLHTFHDVHFEHFGNSTRDNFFHWRFRE